MMAAQLLVEGEHSSSERVSKDASHFPRVASLVTFPERQVARDLPCT
jgi:hypothetical protein